MRVALLPRPGTRASSAWCADGGGCGQIPRSDRPHRGSLFCHPVRAAHLRPRWQARRPQLAARPQPLASRPPPARGRPPEVHATPSVQGMGAASACDALGALAHSPLVPSTGLGYGASSERSSRTHRPGLQGHPQARRHHRRQPRVWAGHGERVAGCGGRRGAVRPQLGAPARGGGGACGRAGAHRVHGMSCDCSDPGAMRRFGAFVQERLGGVDLWLNNAGELGW